MGAWRCKEFAWRRSAVRWRSVVGVLGTLSAAGDAPAFRPAAGAPLAGTLGSSLQDLVYGGAQGDSQDLVYGGAQGDSQDLVYGGAQGDSQDFVYGGVQGDSQELVDGGAPMDSQIVFVDEDGDVNKITSAAGQLQWCSGQQLFGQRMSCFEVRELRVDLHGQCRFKVTFRPRWRPNPLVSVIAQPQPGLLQRSLAERLLQMALSQGIEVSWDPLSMLRASNSSGGEASGDSPIRAWKPELNFPLPLVPGGSRIAAPTRAQLRIPGEWREQLASRGETLAQAGVCIAIVKSPEDCNVCTFSEHCAADLRVIANELGPTRVGHELVVEVPRPNFSVVAEAEDRAHSVCLRGRGPLPVLADARVGLVVLGRVQYFQLPSVQFLPSEVRVGVRTFLNPGWHHDIMLECTNCTSRSRLSIHPVVLHPYCRGMPHQTLEMIAAAARDGQLPANVELKHHKNSKVAEIVKTGGTATIQDEAINPRCKMPKHGPCGGSVESAVRIAGLSAQASIGTGEATFTVESERRLLARERQMLFHHWNALCFYPDGDSSMGWLVGFAAIHMDGPDMQAFIGFVCFFGVALPLICLVTSLLHFNKYERCKQHVQHLRMGYQRHQLNREMGVRRIQLPTGSWGAPPPPPRPQASRAAASGFPELGAGLVEPLPFQFVSLLSGSHIGSHIL